MAAVLYAVLDITQEKTVPVPCLDHGNRAFYDAREAEYPLDIMEIGWRHSVLHLLGGDS